MMNDEQWIVIPRWWEFQHYRDRDPTWIKSYRRLLNDDAYVALSFRRRGILHGLWLLYAASDGLVSGSSPARVGFLLGDPTVRARDIEALNHAGFIEFSASKPLALRYQAASPETETETEDPLPHAEHGDEQSEIESNGNDGPIVSCNVCGNPVGRWKRCTICGANPREAGSSARDLSKSKKKKPPYTLAEAMTRNGGWQYELPAFREELDRFDLTADEREKLIQLRDQLAARDAIATATNDNPFL